MAESSIRIDDLCRALAPADQALQPTIIRTGWLGNSPRKGYNRLYVAGPHLSEWLEFADEDLVHEMKADKAAFPFGGSFVWLKENAALCYGRSHSNPLRSSFLDGSLRTQLMPQADLAAPGGVAFTGLPCVVTISLIACTFFDTCSHGPCDITSEPPT